MNKKRFLLTSLLLTFAQATYADIVAEGAYARETAPSATTSAIFVTLSNPDSENIELVSATASKAGKVELHDMIKEGDVMKMRQVEKITVPAKGKTELKPGGYHVMLFDLAGPLKEGENISVKLNFSNQQSISFDAPIKKVMMGMKASHHH
ncbi:copper chaperone PCu(A)C [Vibrio sp. WJH972]